MLRRIPVNAILIALLAVVMLVPAVQAANAGEWREGRGFLYGAILCLFVAGAFAVLLRPMSERDLARQELLTMLLAWVVLPGFAALPLLLLTPAVGVLGAYFEMVAALTTTGGSIYPRGFDVPDSVHLWRGIVGWFGGLMTLMAAYVILAPRRLGGFEVTAARAETVTDVNAVDLRLPSAPFESRVLRALRTILPVYVAMTAILGIAFNAFDKPGLTSAVHAMSIVSTSGISPEPEGFATSRSIPAEIFAAIFMVLAATRLLYSGASQSGQRATWRTDPELRLMAVLVGLATVALFVRHWVGVMTIDAAAYYGAEPGAMSGLEALWGAFFTSLSFSTTTGFHSAAWESARNWSGLANPGLVLLGLCAIGGGAATTAGGIKLIRAFAMLRHGVRELDRIAKPHSVAGAGLGSRGLRREGATIAWAFMMLFFLGFVVTLLGLTLTGMRFMDGLIAATAALSNTGPAYALIAESGRTFATLQPVQHMILAAAMLLGRIETLAIIVLMHPEVWAQFGARAKKTGKRRSETPLSKW